MVVDTGALSSCSYASDAVKAMVLSLPDLTVGNHVHDLFVNQLQASLPGREDPTFGKGPSYREIFFPTWSPDPDLPLLTATIALPDAWWSALAAAVLCQSIDVQAGGLGGQLERPVIDAAVASSATTLNALATPLYTAVLPGQWPDFGGARAQAPPDAVSQYSRVLVDNVPMMTLWYADGLWSNPDWALFHHCVKLTSLGMAAPDVTALVAQLGAAGLPVPDDIAGGRWTSYAGFLTQHPQVDHTDIDDVAAGAITAVVHEQGTGPSGFRYGHCYSFTAHGQPGGSFRRKG